MKKMMLTAIALFLLVIVHAQHVRSNQIRPGNGDTTWHNLQPKRTKIINGNALMKQEPGKLRLYATYRKGRVTNWYAIDTKGREIPATYTAKAATCTVCIDIENELHYCYDIDCDDLPKGKLNAVMTAH